MSPDADGQHCEQKYTDSFFALPFPASRSSAHLAGIRSDKLNKNIAITFFVNVMLTPVRATGIEGAENISLASMNEVLMSTGAPFGAKMAERPRQ